MTISSIKAIAKKQLATTSGKYALFALPIILILTNLSVSMQSVPWNLANNSFSLTISNLLVTFLLLLFTLSANFTMLEARRQGRSSVTFSDNQLAFAKDYLWRLLGLYLLQIVFISLWLLLAALGASLIALALYLRNIDSTTPYPLIIAALGILLFLIGFGAAIFYQYAYRMAGYLAFDAIKQNRYDGAIVTLKDSIALMKGHKFKLFLFDLSFTGWSLLVPFTLGLVYIYLIPYFNTAETVFYQKLLQEL